jgi:hypothetical protein
VIDCADPAALSEFWAQATGYVLQPPPEGYGSWEDFLRERGFPEEAWNDASAVVDPDGVGPRIYFQRVPEGKTLKNRVHLDLSQGTSATPPDERRRLVDVEAERLQGIGASFVSRNDRGHEFWIVMQDPEGNEFCLH